LSRSTDVPGSPTADRLDARVAAIILTLNQREATLRCLDSLARSGATALAVILFDNGSADGTAAAVRREHPGVRVIRSEHNLGAAAGRNEAAAAAIEQLDPEFLLFLDNDTEVRTGFLEALLEPLETDPALGQSAPKLLLRADPSRIDMAGGARIAWWRGETTGRGRGEPDVGQYDEPGTCVAGGCTLVRTEAFQSVGGFDTVFDPYGYEDMDFSLRLAAQGRGCVYAPRAVILHANTQTYEGGRYTARYAARKARNWLIFLFRHAPPVSRLAFLVAGVPWLVLRRLVKGLAP
jgi:GT2 family glycosyltransferase